MCWITELFTDMNCSTRIIAWHASAGFFSQFLVQPDNVKKMVIPDKVAQTCRDWGLFTSTEIPDQIDSGV